MIYNAWSTWLKSCFLPFNVGSEMRVVRVSYLNFSPIRNKWVMRSFNLKCKQQICQQPFYYTVHASSKFLRVTKILLFNKNGSATTVLYTSPYPLMSVHSVTKHLPFQLVLNSSGIACSENSLSSPSWYEYVQLSRFSRYKLSWSGSLAVVNLATISPCDRNSWILS